MSNLSPSGKPDTDQPSRPVGRFSERAIWLCENRKTRYKTRIQGTLAEILKKYPADYRLKLLTIKEYPHEHPAATGE